MFRRQIRELLPAPQSAQLASACTSCGRDSPVRDWRGAAAGNHLSGGEGGGGASDVKKGEEIAFWEKLDRQRGKPASLQTDPGSIFEEQRNGMDDNKKMEILSVCWNTVRYHWYRTVLYCLYLSIIIINHKHRLRRAFWLTCLCRYRLRRKYFLPALFYRTDMSVHYIGVNRSIIRTQKFFSPEPFLFHSRQSRQGLTLFSMQWSKGVDEVNVVIEMMQDQSH